MNTTFSNFVTGMNLYLVIERIFAIVVQKAIQIFYSFPENGTHAHPEFVDQILG